MSQGTVLVVARHGGYALELRRAGLTVVEAEDFDGAEGPALDACVIDAVLSDAQAPPSWERWEPALVADGGPPVVAVVSQRPPPWLNRLTARALLVSAPISGRVLVQHVNAAMGRSASTLLGVPEKDEDVIDLALSPEQVIDLVDQLDREAEVGTRPLRSTGLPDRAHVGMAVLPSQHGLSVPLRMARLSEVADRLLEYVATIRTLRSVSEELATTLAEQLRADVAVLVVCPPDAAWTVLGGSGLRQLEWRPVPRDPPVLGLLDAKRPILRVESSDDVRQSAFGLPCVSRAHLLIARYPTRDVLVTVGRNDLTFSSDDVRTLGHLLREEDGWDDALAMCELGERLLPYLDT